MTHLPFLVAFSLTVGTPAQSKYLSIGDPAPPLTTATWLKGQPIATFEKGQVYVVEFWATWCHPCRDNIPHLTALAKKYSGQAEIIGVDVWENAKPEEGNLMTRVKAFVKSEGDQMDYHVAADNAKTNFIADHYLKAASEGGIPCSFIVDREGKVAWIGHPASMEDTLKQVIAGNYDESAAREKREIEIGVTRKIESAMERKDYAGVDHLITAAVKARPKLEMALTYTRMVALFHYDLAKGEAAARKILTDSNHENGAYQMLSSIFASQPDLSKAAYKYGLTVIEEGKKQGMAVSLYLAMEAATYHNMKDRANAIKFAEQAVAQSDAEPNAPAEMKALFKRDLAKYKANKN